MATEKLNFHDRVAELSFKQFNSLCKSGKPTAKEWTILSCILQEDDGNLKVIALGTGTKCIGHDKMSEYGDILNDSHAEVICRRAFLRYLYENMLTPQTDFLKYNTEDQKFHIKDGIKFHFFTTHVPCGDAAIFAKQNVEYFGDLVQVLGTFHKEQNNDCDCSEKKKRKVDESTSRDIFRTGAKCLESDAKQDLHLEGENYHVTGVVRTKPGRGIKTLSVSCSDKLAKWCHLGIQGALLSILLKKPIYLNSFTIAAGTPFNEEAMKRALFSRLGNVQLKHPYCRSELVFGHSNLSFSFSKSGDKKPCPTSIIWLYTTNNTNKQVEVAVEGKKQGLTKKQIKTAGKLKICKAELFSYFIEVVKQFQIKFENDVTNSTYKNAKQYGTHYQESWTILKEHFKTWTVKNDNLLEFHG